MAFAQQTASVSASSKDAKPVAYLNVYFPTANGTRAKIGALGLKESTAIHKFIMDTLSIDPNKIEALKGKIQIDFQLASKEATFEL